MSNSITYKSIKFVKLPNASGIVPLKSFAERMLQDTEIFSMDTKS